MSEEIDVNSLHAEVQTLKQMLENQNRVYTARSQVDDARSLKLDCRLDDLETRVDKHGNRTTAVETQFVAFFGEQGAFRLVMKKLDEQASKMDKLVIAGFSGSLAIIGALIVYLVEKH